MATRRDELYPESAGEPADNALARAQAALTGALTELSLLTQDPLFDRVDGVVADLVNAPASPQVGLDTVHKLRDFSAEHQRVAIELETAARCCRLAEREINRRVDALLAGWDEGLSAARGPDPAAQPAIARRRIGRDGRLGTIFHRSRGGPQPPGESRAPVTRELEQASSLLPTAPTAPDPTASPADITARALGPLEVRVAGQLVSRWNSLKARAVFQYLLVHQDRPTPIPST